jgi:ubiquitin-protein ligase
MDELKMMEKAGKLRVKMCEKKFFCTVDITVPGAYPAKKPEIKFIENNYDPNFAKIFEG